MLSKGTQNFIILWVLLIAGMAALSLSYQAAYPNPVVRQSIQRIEPFQNAVSFDPEGNIAGVTALEPSATSLDQPRQPYSLLLDVLPAYTGAPATPTSKGCYEADFQNRLERTGHFRQLTNNYKRGVPDSCSAPNHDLALSFYKVDPLPFKGYLQ